MYILVIKYSDGSKDVSEWTDEKSIKGYIDATYRKGIDIQIYKGVNFTYTPPVSSLVID